MRPTGGIFIDSSLLVLLVVGATNRELIAKHKRLKNDFCEEDFDLLKRIVRETVGVTNRVLVTPNTLTESSNLLDKHGEPERSRLFDTLRLLIEGIFEETVIGSADAARNEEFLRLGLTDAVLLERVSPKTPLLTVDFELHGVALKRNGHNAAINFMHLRNMA
ncbi:MAG: hypothetical protein OXH85_10605 [Truepera sp.]|nr:hypothetical protein [Truepera sp.]